MGFKREESQVGLHKLFWDIWNECGYSLPERTDLYLCIFPLTVFVSYRDHSSCYHFQLATREHRYMVNYRSNRVFLVSCFDLVNGCELDPCQISVFDHSLAA